MLCTTDGRNILDISWKEKITNVAVKAGQQIMDNIRRKRELRWLGHVIRMDHQRTPQQAYTRIQERTRSTKNELEERS